MRVKVVLRDHLGPSGNTDDRAFGNVLSGDMRSALGGDSGERTERRAKSHRFLGNCIEVWQFLHHLPVECIRSIKLGEELLDFSLKLGVDFGIGYEEE